MTKITFIGNEPTKKSKHIELVRQYLGTHAICTTNEWRNVQLIKRNVKDGLDLILCFDDDGTNGMHLGHWNDGTTSNTDTICTVLGEDVAEKKGKGIEFVKFLSPKNMSFVGAAKANEFKHIDVICANYTFGGLSVFFAYDNERTSGGIYLGHLNDGFVE